jgi:dienelactone hydrolase
MATISRLVYRFREGNKCIKLLFGSSLIYLLIIFTATVATAAIISKIVPYQSEGMNLNGYLAYDDANSGKLPGVLVIHHWWGLNDSVRKRADQLASMGYVAFALDLYGKGKTTTNFTKATKMLRMVQMNGYRWRQRALAGLEVLRRLPQVDPQRIAAIGYGWGGATLQQLVFKGEDIKGAVLFGSFLPPPIDQAAKVKAKILVLQGAADPYLDSDELTAYFEAMEKYGLDWQMVLFGGAKHGFSDSNAANYGMKEFVYNEVADRQSWSHVTLFLKDQI